MNAVRGRHLAAAGETPPAVPGRKPPPEQTYEQRGPRPPEPPPERPETPPAEVGHPLLRVLFYLGSIFFLLNVTGLLALWIYSHAIGGPEEPMERFRTLAENVGGSQVLALYAVSAPFAIAWTVFFRRALQRRRLSTLGLGGRRRPLKVLLGGLAGLVASGFVLLVCALSGAYEIRWPESSPAYDRLALLALGFFVQAATEELIVRGYAQKNMVEWRGDKRSIGWILVFPSLVFALAHLTNPENGVIAAANTFLLGFALGAVVLWQGDLWAAIGVHWGWNFSLASLWSLPVSGLSTPGWLDATRVEDSPEWAVRLLGGAYGPEGGLLVTILAALAISIVLPIAVDRWPRDRWGARER